MSSYTSFIDLALTFKPLIHVELIFVQGSSLDYFFFFSFFLLLGLQRCKNPICLSNTCANQLTAY